MKDYRLIIQFAEGITKIYDMNDLIRNNELFKKLKNKKLFDSVEVDIGGYGAIWSDEMQQIFGGLMRVH